MENNVCSNDTDLVGDEFTDHEQYKTIFNISSKENPIATCYSIFDLKNHLKLRYDPKVLYDWDDTAPLSSLCCPKTTLVDPVYNRLPLTNHLVNFDIHILDKYKYFYIDEVNKNHRVGSLSFSYVSAEHGADQQSTYILVPLDTNKVTNMIKKKYISSDVLGCKVHDYIEPDKEIWTNVVKDDELYSFKDIFCGKEMKNDGTLDFVHGSNFLEKCQKQVDDQKNHSVENKPTYANILNRQSTIDVNDELSTSTESKIQNTLENLFLDYPDKTVVTVDIKMEVFRHDKFFDLDIQIEGDVVNDILQSQDMLAYVNNELFHSIEDKVETVSLIPQGLRITFTKDWLIKYVKENYNDSELVMKDISVDGLIRRLNDNYDFKSSYIWIRYGTKPYIIFAKKGFYNINIKIQKNSKLMYDNILITGEFIYNRLYKSSSKHEIIDIYTYGLDKNKVLRKCNYLFNFFSNVNTVRKISSAVYFQDICMLNLKLKTKNEKNIQVRLHTGVYSNKKDILKSIKVACMAVGWDGERLLFNSLSKFAHEYRLIPLDSIYLPTSEDFQTAEHFQFSIHKGWSYFTSGRKLTTKYYELMKINDNQLFIMGKKEFPIFPYNYSIDRPIFSKDISNILSFSSLPLFKKLNFEREYIASDGFYNYLSDKKSLPPAVVVSPEKFGVGNMVDIKHFDPHLSKTNIGEDWKDWYNNELKLVTPDFWLRPNSRPTFGKNKRKASVEDDSTDPCHADSKDDCNKCKQDEDDAYPYKCSAICTTTRKNCTRNAIYRVSSGRLVKMNPDKRLRSLRARTYYCWQHGYMKSASVTSKK